MSDNNSFIIKLQAMLDKVKSLANIKKDIKEIEPKLPKIKIAGALDKKTVDRELKTKLKDVNAKIKVDADTTSAEKKIKKMQQKNSETVIRNKVDNPQLVSRLKEAQKETKTLWERFVGGIAGISLIEIGVQKIVQTLHQAIANIKELDAIKTNIQMVSGTSDSDVNAMMSSYNAMAKSISSTTKEVAEAANEFLRMGESIETTNELIKSSQILSKTGMIESSEAASYLISSLKGYQISAENSVDVVSKLTSVDLEAAVSAGGLAEAISKCSNIANNSGTSMDRLIGYTAAVGEVTQESMSVIGNSFKSMYSRMNNIKIGRFVDDETGESLSDTEAVLNKLGIQLRDTADTYRDFDDVLDDIGGRWNSLTQVEQNALSVAIAGTMQRERFIVLMNNYSKALEYSETAANSAGSALERYEAYQDSIEAKTNELTAAIESLSMNTVNEELYSGIIVATTNIVEFIDKANLLKGTLAGIVTMGISKTFVSIATGIISASRSTAQLTAAMKLFDNGRSVDNLRDIGAACKGLSEKQLKLVLSTKGLKNEQRLTILEGLGLEEAERQQTLTTLGFAAAEDKATVSTFSLKGAFRSLGAAMAANPIGVITTAVSVATMVFSGFNQAMEEAQQKARDLGEEIKNTKSDIDSYKSKIEELHSTINDETASISDVTEARKNLITIQDELIDKFGTEESVINNVTDAINGQTDALNKLTKTKWQEIKNEFNNGDFWNNIANFFQGTDNIQRMLDEYGEQNIAFRWADYAGDNIKLTDGMVAELENIGVDIKVSTDNLQSMRDFDSLTESIEDAKGATLILSGNAEEIYNKILSLQNLINGDDSYGKLYENIERHANSYEELTDKYKDFYNQYILQEKIFAEDSKYANTFKDITDAVEKYNEAFISGNEKEIKKASDEYASLLSSAMATAIANGDSDVATYFKNMYPTLTSIIDDWKFNIDFDANTDNLQGKVHNVLNELKDENGRSLTVEEILGLGESNEQYQDLISIAHSYNMTLEEMIRLLEERNLVSAMDYQGLVGLFGQEDVDKLTPEDLEIAYTIKNVGNITFEQLQIEIQKVKEFANENPTSFDFSTNKDTIDNFQSKMNTLGDALSSIRSGNFEDSDLTDLLQEFPELADKTDDLETAVTELINNSLEALYATLGEGIPEGLKSSLQEITNLALGTATHLSDAFSSIHSSWDILQDFKEAMDEGFDDNVTDDLLQSVRGLSGELETLVAGYYSGVVTAEELYDALTKHYENDLQNYSTALIRKNELNETFYNAVGMASEEVTNHFMDDYDIDLKNCRNYNQAKLEIEKQTLGKISGAWSQYYDTQSQTLKMSLGEIQARAAHGSGDAQAFLEQYELIENYEKAMKELDKITYDGIRSNFDSIGSRLDKNKDSSKDSKDTTETFNWIETAVSRIQRVITNLGNAVSATWRNWTHRNSSLASELEEVRKEIELQQSAYEAYMKKAESVGLSEGYKNLVRNGGLSIEDIADETLKEQIKEYQEWYEKALDCEDAVSELNDTLADLAKTKFDNITAQFDAKIQDIDHTVSLINGELEKAETQNQIAGESFYNALIDRENMRLESLAAEYAEKLSALNEFVSSGVIESGSEAWQEMKADIDSVAEAIQEADNQILEYEKDLKEIAKLKFDSLESQFDNALGLISAELSQVDKQVALVEEAGYKAGEAFYQALIEMEQSNVEALVSKYESLSSSLAEALDNGSVKQFDDNWYDMVGSINDVEDALLDAESALVSYGNSLKELEWDVFDRMQDSISGLTEESDFLINLMSTNNDLYNKNGTYNDRGISVQGLHAVNYDTYMRQAQEYSKAIQEINEDLADDPNNMTLIDRYNELLELQREAVLNAEDEKSAIKDLISEGYDRLLSYLDELIDARKKAMNAEKDLHDYEKTISEQTATVDKFQKLLTAYQGDDSEGMKATIQKAQAGLIEAQEALQETEYEKYMSDQEAMLDTFRDDMEEWINLRLDDINGLIQQAVSATNANAKTISAQIGSDLSKVGMTLTDNFAKIFEIDYSGGVRDIISGYYGGDGDFATAMTTLNTAIDGIVVKSDDIKMSTDGITAVLNQRFPELAAALPNLDTTNGRIVEVKSAIDLVRQAIEAINVTVANLNLGKAVSPVQPNTSTSNTKPANTTAVSAPSAPTAPASPVGTAKPAGSNTAVPAQTVKYSVRDADTLYFYLKDATQSQCSAYISSHNMQTISVNGNVYMVRYKQATATKKTTIPVWRGGGGRPVNLQRYAKGIHDADKEEIAYTDENGQEFILSPLRGGILTHIMKGDTVMTHEQSERIFQLSQMDPAELKEFFFGGKVPELNVSSSMPNASAPVNNNTSNNDVTVNITVPNITNKQEFNDYLRSREASSYIKRMVADGMLGRNQYNRYGY